MTTQCDVCHGPIPECRLRRRGVRFCSNRCGKEFRKYAYQRLNKRLGIPSSTVGAIAELMVATDLMRQGFDVFRALSPSCSCDLAVLVHNTLFRVEVRTGSRTNNGPRAGMSGNYDIHALVLHDTRDIIYTPHLPTIIRPSHSEEKAEPALLC